jgi:hypothetical protein
VAPRSLDAIEIAVIREVAEHSSRRLVRPTAFSRAVCPLACAVEAATTQRVG